MESLEDYAGYTSSNNINGELTNLRELAEQQLEAEQKVEELQKALKKAQEHLKNLSEFEIPNAMDEIGMPSFTTNTGLIVEISEKIRASIPKEKQPMAFSWLRKNGHENLIKNTVSILFGKGDNEQAQKLVSELSKEKLNYTDKSSVHPSTLASFVSEKLTKGEDIPLELFGVYRQRISKLKIKK